MQPLHLLGLQIRLKAGFWSQIVKLHDVDGTMKILMREAGPVFEKQVKEWGAVHAAPDRYYPPLHFVYTILTAGAQRIGVVGILPRAFRAQWCVEAVAAWS